MNVFARAGRNAKVLALAETLHRLYARVSDPKPSLSDYARAFDGEARRKVAVLAGVYVPSEETWEELVRHLERCERDGGFGLGPSAPVTGAASESSVNG